MLTTLSLVLLFAPASEPSPEAAAFFRKEVEPLLKANCYTCHSHAANKSKGGLVVDSRAALLTGGDSGPAVVPANVGDSLLLTAITYEDESLQMPPKGKLPDDQIEIFRKWVEMGAPWPGSSAAVKAPVRPRGVITDEDRQWWAFQPVRAVPPPEGDGRPIDRFIRDQLRSAGLKPSPSADKAVLARRLHFDLTGLPPTPEQVEQFVRDDRPDAYERLVDQLLDSPHYGERMARLWLDLVRYAESDGYRLDEYRPHAWRYRDYVVRSFNNDKPYDRFVREQLAGDEIAPHDPDALAGSGYLWLGIYEYNNRDVRTQWDSMLNDLTDVTGDVFLGLGAGCARCHDHKFDPILQKDYFRLKAFFSGLTPGELKPLATPEQLAEYQRRYAAWESATADLRARIDQLEAPARKQAARSAIEKFPPDIQEMLHKPDDELPPSEKQLARLAYRQVDYEFDRLDRRLKDPAKSEVLQLRKELEKFDHLKPEPLPQLMIGGEVGPVAAPTIFPKKGGPEPVEPGFLTIWDAGPARIDPPAYGRSTGRRTALAHWLTRPEHPLTARVIVNRLWQMHFGRGLAAHASDFGKLGEPPSHPELLDWLAGEVIRHDWRLKPMHRMMVTSETYRQTATPADAEAGRTKDPENRLLWRMPTRRLEAEMVRDTILAVTGQLDRSHGGPATDMNKPRRTIYCRAQRNVRDPLLDSFDLPDGFSSASDRNVTTTPTQALLLFNGPGLLHHAKAFAARLMKEEPSNDVARIDRAWRLAFGRPATERELTAAAAFLEARSKSAKPLAKADAAALELQFGRVPYREGRAVLVDPKDPPPLRVPDRGQLPDGDFTIEAFVVLRSLNDDATVRVIAAHGSEKTGGWSVGVTSRKSAYKPQTLVLQLWASDAGGSRTYEPLFSGLHVDLNKPYFVSAAVELGRDGRPGRVTFATKDLSNDDEPTQTAAVPTKAAGFPEQPRGPLHLGTVIGGKKGRGWDGLIDDVRLSLGALKTEQLLLTSDGVSDRTVGYWQFEAVPGPMKDASPGGSHLDAIVSKSDAPPLVPSAADQAAWVEFCQVLLNANEFLYVD